ncbi:hypothetical protein O181_006113 [Austropuccinia psidii MF-1]|uniref:Uncharacterized protein n=1 Tax=Austropuccinia psidii MF-1 TaxID=1389203 RepID=A0A9Q3BJK2_9BASI|nr:hypothetical protein [Austropuccinia psidii MF-1]
MDQQSTSNLPPLPPEDNVEEQYPGESEDEDQNEIIQSLIKKMQEVLLTQRKKRKYKGGHLQPIHLEEGLVHHHYQDM